MRRKELIREIQTKQSYLCIGLDTDINKIPKHLHAVADPIFEFNKAIIEATHDLCVAYKPNLAFYESLGPKGWETLEKTMELIPNNIFTIADAKRGDIGNTSKMYAKTFFEYLDFDAVTVAPYMGQDSVTPFLEYENKWVILLGLTSNAGSADFQRIEAQGKPIWYHVLKKSLEWSSFENIMYVIGATHGSDFLKVRDIVPNHFLLVPGLGAQGGDLNTVSSNGLNRDYGLLVNSSRDIIYAGDGDDFAHKARENALKVQKHMASILQGQYS
jgi:orotidine-5'-phosphate decarboxylase